MLSAPSLGCFVLHSRSPLGPPWELSPPAWQLPGSPDFKPRGSLTVLGRSVAPVPIACLAVEFLLGAQVQSCPSCSGERARGQAKLPQEKDERKVSFLTFSQNRKTHIYFPRVLLRDLGRKANPESFKSWGLSWFDSAERAVAQV